jgi:hypothetical protein
MSPSAAKKGGGGTSVVAADEPANYAEQFPIGNRRAAARKAARSDLTSTPLPAASPQDWIEPEVTLVKLYRRAEKEALDAIGWYLCDKKAKKRASQVLRAVAILLAAGGGLIPLITVASQHSQWAPWGYVLLAGAASCVAFDRFFGLSAAWMRDISGAQGLQKRLGQFQYAWSRTCASPPADDVNAKLLLLSEFVDDVSDMIRQETTEWTTEFESSLARIEAVTAASKSN